MPSFWSRIVRFVDRILGDPPFGQNDVDSALVEEAIRIIQSHVDTDRKDRLVKRLRISDLSPEHRAQLAAQLAQLLRSKQDQDKKGRQDQGPEASP